jgi:hypothetical protein
MANGFPQGFPSPQPYDVQVMPAQFGPQPPPYVPPAPEPTPEVVPFAAQLGGHGGRRDAWGGVWVVAGGVVGLAGLLAWVAVKNEREHKVLQREIEGTNLRLDDYIEEHAIDHAKIAQRQAAVDDYLSRNVDRLWTTMGVPWASRKTMPMERAPVPPMAATLPSYVEPTLSARPSSLPSYARLMAEAVRSVEGRASSRAVSSGRRSTAPATVYEAEGLPVPSFRAVTSPYSQTLTGVGTAVPVSRAYVEALEEATAFPAAFSEAPTQVYSPVPSALSRVLSTTPTGNGATLDFSVPRNAGSASFRPSVVVPVATALPAPLSAPSAGLLLVPSAAPTLRSQDLPTLTALMSQRTTPRSSRSRQGDDAPPTPSSRRSHRSTRRS